MVSDCYCYRHRLSPRNAQANEVVYLAWEGEPRRRAAAALKAEGLNAAMPWFIGLSPLGKKLLLLDGYELHTPDVLHSFGRLMRDMGIGVVDLCIAWKRRGSHVTYSNRISEQQRFRPHGIPALRRFPRVFFYD